MEQQFTDKLLQYLESGEVFLKTELPEIAQQYLNWGVTESYVLIVSLFIACLLLAVATYIVNKVENSLTPIPFGLFIAISLISMILTINGVLTIYKIKTAPKVYLIDKLMKAKQ